MVGSRWESRERSHLWKDDTLKSIKILISMIYIYHLIFIQTFFSLLCSLMYSLIYIDSQRGRQAEIWSNHLQARGSYTMWPSATKSWQNSHLPINQVRPKKWKFIGRRKLRSWKRCMTFLWISIHFHHVLHMLPCSCWLSGFFTHHPLGNLEFRLTSKEVDRCDDAEVPLEF